MRNLTKTLAAVSLLAPANAYPLGIGDIKLHSSLNQNLNAEIALLVSSGEKISDIKVRLAPPEKFDEAGVPWSYFLSKIKFEAVTRADGSSIVKLSSKEALREPFLDFLLEVTWENGNLYREFTVLVDPPAAYTQPTIQVVEKSQKKTETKNPKSNISTQSASGSLSSNGVASAQYGPTNSRDSLWKVAEKTNVYDDVSIEQMMMAIYEANPGAFYKKNVNALKAGQTLSIPEKEVILKLSQREAYSAFKQQNNVWNGRVAAKKQAQQSVEPPVIRSQLELQAPVEAEIDQQTAVVVDESDVSAEVGIVDSEIDGVAVSTGDKSLALQARLEKLEQQLNMMQKMLSLKDEQIAALQSQAQTTGTINDQSKTQQKLDSSTDSSQKNNEVGVTKNEPPKSVAPKVKPKPKPAVKPKPRKVVQAEPESDDTFTMMLGGVGLVVLAILGLFLWRKRKIEDETDNESMFASASEISLPDSTAEDVTVAVMDDEASYDVGTVGESSFLSEFTPSDFDAFDTEQNEVDPISEADVYLAYGRYQQAEDLMRQAIIDQPEREECKLKLLEIFYANENKAAFEEYARELVDAGKHNDHDFWAKVAEMGVEIAPESGLFSDIGADKANFETEDIDEPVETSVLIENSVESSQQENVDSDLEVTDTAVDSEIDFDLSAFGQESNEIEKEKSDDNELDFDLSVFDIDENASEESNEIEATVAVDEPVSFDTETIELSDLESETLANNESSQVNDIESFDFELNNDNESRTEDNVVPDVNLEEELESFDFSTDDTPETSVEIQNSEITEEDDIEGFDFDFDLGTEPVVSSEADAALNVPDTEVSDLTDMDELETKIDLAKAYIDMGDTEAAKSIAEEVLEKGTSEQKAVAQAIIEQLK